MKFKDFPFIIKLAVYMTLLNSWVIFEEVVVDRNGLWQYMPFYKVGAFCSWDATAMVIIAMIVFGFKDYLKKLCFVKTCKICND